MKVTKVDKARRARFRTCISIACLGLGAFWLAGCGSPPQVSLSLEGTAGPLERFLNEIELAGASTVEETTQKKRDAENAISLCMKNQGFLYTPDIPKEVKAVKSSEIPLYGSEEFAIEYGFGIALQPEGAAEIESEASRANSQYLDSLSGTEYEAYREALYGSAVTDNELDEETEMRDPEDFGCYDSSYAEFFQADDQDNGQDPELASFLESAASFYDSLEQPSQVDRLIALWKACMESNGYGEYATSAPETVQEALEIEYDALIMDAGISPEDYSNPRLEEFINKELAVAKSDVSCRAKFDFNKQRNLVFNKLEEAFMNEHKAEVDRLRSRLLG